MPGESVLTSVVHKCAFFKNGNEIFWETMGMIYGNLENLRSLQINLPPMVPKRCDDSREKAAVRMIAHLLPLVRGGAAPHARIRPHCTVQW